MIPSKLTPLVAETSKLLPVEKVLVKKKNSPSSLQAPPSRAAIPIRFGTRDETGRVEKRGFNIKRVSRILFRISRKKSAKFGKMVGTIRGCLPLRASPFGAI